MITDEKEVYNSVDKSHMTYVTLKLSSTHAYIYINPNFFKLSNKIIYLSKQVINMNCYDISIPFEVVGMTIRPVRPSRIKHGEKTFVHTKNKILVTKKYICPFGIDKGILLQQQYRLVEIILRHIKIYFLTGNVPTVQGIIVQNKYYLYNFFHIWRPLMKNVLYAVILVSTRTLHESFPMIHRQFCPSLSQPLNELWRAELFLAQLLMLSDTHPHTPTQ